MGALEPPHLLLILAIVLIIFGPGKLPQLGKAVGDGLRELRHATSDDSTIRHDSPSAPATALVSASATHHTCPHCQAQVPAADRFCGACGASLGAPASAVTSGSSR